MILPDKVYNVLKWLCLTVLPALAVLITIIFKECGIPHYTEIATIINGLAWFIGVCIGVSQININNANKR